MRVKIFVACLALFFMFSCNRGGGVFIDPEPTPTLSEEEAVRLAEERSRRERELEWGGVPSEEEPMPVPASLPPLSSQTSEKRPVTSGRPLNAEEIRILHEALSGCTDKPTTVEVWVEPGGLPFLAPNQRFPETELECFARRVGTVRLSSERQRRGTVALP